MTLTWHWLTGLVVMDSRFLAALGMTESWEPDHSCNFVLLTPVSPPGERHREGVFAIQLTKAEQLEPSRHFDAQEHTIYPVHVAGSVSARRSRTRKIVRDKSRIKARKFRSCGKNLKSSHDGIVCRVCVADTASKRPALTGETERDKLRTGGENWKFGRYPKLSHRLRVSRN